MFEELQGTTCSDPDEMVRIMMPDIDLPGFARECWEDWLCLEPGEEIVPSEVRAFLDAAFEVWRRSQFEF